jgi:hypothetical protein
MPRLSVDLDLVFPDHGQPRDQALARIGEALQQSAERLKARGFQTRVQAAADACGRLARYWLFTHLFRTAAQPRRLSSSSSDGDDGTQLTQVGATRSHADQ